LSRTRPETGFLFPFVCGIGTRIGIKLFGKNKKGLKNT
jgi:hypothetical protein